MCGGEVRDEENIDITMRRIRETGASYFWRAPAPSNLTKDRRESIRLRILFCFLFLLLLLCIPLSFSATLPVPTLRKWLSRHGSRPAAFQLLLAPNLIAVDPPLVAGDISLSGKGQSLATDLNGFSPERVERKGGVAREEKKEAMERREEDRDEEKERDGEDLLESVGALPLR
jgi:hypothetical protein